MKFTKDTSGWERMKKQLLTLDKLEVQVGWHDTYYGSENDNLPHAYIGAIQEEGSSEQNIPPRPYMRVGFRDFLKSGKADQNFVAVMKSVMDGQTALKAYKQAGPAFVKHLQAVMNAWNTPPNAPLTVSLKGFNDPLRETGELIDSVDFEIGKS